MKRRRVFTPFARADAESNHACGNGLTIRSSHAENFLPWWALYVIQGLHIPRDIRAIIAAYTVHPNILALYSDSKRCVSKPILFWSLLKQEFHSASLTPTSLPIGKIMSRLCEICFRNIDTRMHPVLNVRCCADCEKKAHIAFVNVHIGCFDYFVQARELWARGTSNNMYVMKADLEQFAIQKHGSLEAIHALREKRTEEYRRVQDEKNARARARREKREQIVNGRRVLLERTLVRVAEEEMAPYESFSPSEVQRDPKVEEDIENYVQWGSIQPYRLSRVSEIARYIALKHKNYNTALYYKFIKSIYTWREVKKYIIDISMGTICDNCHINHKARCGSCRECCSLRYCVYHPKND